MASVLLTSAAPSNDPSWPHPYDQVDRMRASAAQDKFGVHTLTDDPATADVILFVENCSPIRHYLFVRHHAYYRSFPEKCYLHSRYDHPLPLLPGVYPSIERRWQRPHWARSGGYLVAFTNDFAEYDGGQTERSYLYSFVGAKHNHALRESLFALSGDDAYLLDTTPYWPYADLPADEQAALEAQYQDIALRSHFVICPRGRGASSIRLFETMRMGRAPVIISDAWVAPDGPDWASFSVHVPESEIAQLPGLLAERAADAADMGRRARQAWEDWFSAEATFHRTAEACLDMQAARWLPHSIYRAAAFAQFLRPIHFRALVRTWRTQRPTASPPLPA
jgi:hypothetical protein